MTTGPCALTLAWFRCGVSPPEAPHAGSHRAVRSDQGPGLHFMRYRSSWLSIERMRENTIVDLQTGKPWERVTFTTLGSNVGIFSQLLAEAHDLSVRKDEGKLVCAPRPCRWVGVYW
jgi:hypothetical protein